MENNYISLKLPTRDYFDIDEYIEAGYVVPGGLSLINGGRDIGKTTGTFIKWLSKCSPTEQIFFLRNTEKELKAYAKTFNAKFSDKYYMSATEIWTVEKVELINKKTKEVEIHYRKKEVIGFLGALNGVDSWRSANFDSIKYIYSDEYNQIGNSLDAEKFMTLWTSILRTKQNVYTVLIGNRDDIAAEILIELGVEVLIPDNIEGDYIIDMLPDDEDFAKKCFFIDLDDSRFNNNNVPTIWKAVGRKMEVMNAYYDRGYKCYDNADCKRLPKSVMDYVVWDFSHSYEQEITIICGTLNGVVIAHWNKEAYEPKLKFASTEFCAANRGYTPLRNNMEYVFYYLSKAMKDKNIIFTSLQAKEETYQILRTLAIEMEQDEIFEL